MTDPTTNKDFADLAWRCLDGSGTEEDHATLCEQLSSNYQRAVEYASLARFNACLKQLCRQEAKALLEFAALEAEMPTPAPVRSPVLVSAPEHRARRFPWMRVAAILLALIGIAGIWIKTETPDPQVSATTAAPQVVSTILQQDKVITLQHRSIPPARPKISPAPLNEPTLVQRLNDYYLPEVNIRQTRARDAMQQLTAQMKEHNYAKRTDLEQLKVQMPPEAENREVTLESGPISFAKAVEVVAALANTEAVFDQRGVKITDTSRGPSERSAFWLANMNLQQAQQNAASLGLGLQPQDFTEKPGGVEVHAVPHQRRAMLVLSDAQQQLASLAPQRFVPVVFPSSGRERVLTAQETAAIRKQLQTANPGALPVISLQYGNNQRVQLNSSKGSSVVINITPVGELNRITIQPGQTENIVASADPVAEVAPPSEPMFDALGNRISAPPPPAAAAPASNGSENFSGVDAIVEQGQGVEVEIDADPDEIVYTAEGIPVPRSQAHLYGVVSLVFLPET